jgi:hypothetical protein
MDGVGLWGTSSRGRQYRECQRSKCLASKHTQSPVSNPSGRPETAWLAFFSPGSRSRPGATPGEDVMARRQRSSAHVEQPRDKTRRTQFPPCQPAKGAIQGDHAAPGLTGRSVHTSSLGEGDEVLPRKWSRAALETRTELRSFIGLFLQSCFLSWSSYLWCWKNGGPGFIYLVNFPALNL